MAQPQDEPAWIEVEVAHADAQRAVVRNYRLSAPARVQQALNAAAADPAFAGIVIEHAAVGVFGRLAPLDQPLRAGDRVEIYRPLAVDPKAARRARAKQARLRR